MSLWTLDQILEATGGYQLGGSNGLDGTSQAGAIDGIAIDTRTLKPGNAYVAIIGRRFDGHQFVNEALNQGASCLIVSKPSAVQTSCAVPVVLVEDTTLALGDLARFHRKRMNVRVIAVTGSCGKTTTKELLSHLLGNSHSVLKTPGTQNNSIGLPLTLLRLSSMHQYAVVELGSNHPGEIRQLASIAEPDVAIITNVGPAHLAYFGSLVDVLREKISLLEALSSEGIAVLPADQLEVVLEARVVCDPKVRVVQFGTTERADIRATHIQRRESGVLLRLRDQWEAWESPLVGAHNVENILAAISCAWALGRPLSEARERLASFEAPPQRSEIVRLEGMTILNDCYNANPLSCARALETLTDIQGKRHIAILGDMKELGSFAPSAHRAIGRMAAKLKLDVVMAVGEHARDVADGVHEFRANCVYTYGSVPELLSELLTHLLPEDVILIKGSRGMSLEQVTAFLVRRDRKEHGVPAC